MEGPVFQRPVKFGCPWHGLVEIDTLTLPNSDQKSWATLNANGDADIVRLASPPSEPNTTSEEIAAGMEWRNYALVTGKTRILHGKAMGTNHWIYVPSSGNAFHMRIAAFNSGSGTSGGGAISLTIGVRQMAFTGEADSERTFTASLSNIGQGQWDGSDITFSSSQVVLSSQSETGAKVLIELSYAGAVVGWLEGTVLGSEKDGISLTLAVAKTREQTMYRTVDSSQSGANTDSYAYTYTYAAGWLHSAWYEGESAVYAELRLTSLIDYAHWTTYSSIPPYDGDALESATFTDRVQAWVGGSLAAESGWDFVLNKPCKSTGSLASTFLGWDGGETAIYSTVPGLYCPVAGSPAAINWSAHDAANDNWEGASDANKAAGFVWYLTSATPGHPYIYAWHSNFGFLLRTYGRPYYGAFSGDWGTYDVLGDRPHIPAYRKCGRYGMAVEMRDEDIEAVGTITPDGYTALTSPVTLATWNAQASLRVAHQPVTGATSYRSDGNLIGYV